MRYWYVSDIGKGMRGGVGFIALKITLTLIESVYVDEQWLKVDWFEFLRQDDINYFNAKIVRENNEEHCVLEVDLKYTKVLWLA